MKDINILVFGDSIVYGLYDHDLLGWCNRLRKYYDQNDQYTICTYNLGIPGETINDLIKRIEIELNSRLASDNIIVLAVGINDSQYVDNIDRYNINEFYANVNKLLDIALKYSNKILYVGLTNVDDNRVKPVCFNKRKSYDNYKIIEYNKIIKKQCETKDIIFIDVFGLLANDDLKDGLHPNASGHEKLFNVIKNHLNNLIL